MKTLALKFAVLITVGIVMTGCNRYSDIMSSTLDLSTGAISKITYLVSTNTQQEFIGLGFTSSTGNNFIDGVGPIKQPIALSNGQSYVIIEISTRPLAGLNYTGSNVYMHDAKGNKFDGYLYLGEKEGWISLDKIKPSPVEEKSIACLFVVYTRQVKKSVFCFIDQAFKVKDIPAK